MADQSAEDLESISIHALRKESDTLIQFVTHGSVTFQSTLSVRRATLNTLLGGAITYISIHALRKESDKNVSVHCGRSTYFNPRSP